MNVLTFYYICLSYQGSMSKKNLCLGG